MPIESAGILLFREVEGLVEVLLVHPGGPFWARKDDGAWSIPKGEVAGGETPLDTAARELHEELGTPPDTDGDMTPLTPRRQAGGKLVHAWAVRGEFDPESLQSQTFEMEWPPRSGRRQSFPEVDRAAWFPIPDAYRKINGAQTGFLDELIQILITGR